MERYLAEKIELFVESGIVLFHQEKIATLAKLKLKTLLKAKNPYLFRARNIESASGLIQALLDARLSSSEEGIFGNFMERLAVFIVETLGTGQKSLGFGLDIDLKRNGVRYLIAVKSGNNWGNSSQHAKLRDAFNTAVKTLKQNKDIGELQPTLGICYGSFKENHKGNYLHTGGQSFWFLISGDRDLYTQIIEPLGHRAKEFNDAFELEKMKTYNRMTGEFIANYCLESGEIDWKKLVELVSKNMEP